MYTFHKQCYLKIVLFLPKSDEVPSPRTKVKYNIKPCGVQTLIGDPLTLGIKWTSDLRRDK